MNDDFICEEGARRDDRGGINENCERTAQSAATSMSASM
mgnify:CR=1 FL=1